MSAKGSNSLKELKDLREAVLAEEKARTQALLQTLPSNQNSAPPDDLQELAEDEPAIEEFVAPPPAPRPPPPKPPAPAPAPVAPSQNRPKPAAATASKEPALIIPLTPKIQERLQRNTENARWSSADLIIELIRASLHRGYPSIEFGDQVIARAGTYRTLERNPFDAALKIISGQGVFSIAIRPENSEYQRWLEYFQAQDVPSPEKSASQVCLFSLQSYLENVEDFKADGWAKIIPEDGYSLARG